MSIHALPQIAVRAIGSSQSLTDPSSVVKELIDNAIDARATSVSVEISGNTLDVIQVRDNGHGIAPSDRPLVARRYCTSKIKDEKDLMKIGGSFLGFRGEALNSAAEMSGGITITTRIDGEDIATVLRISPIGKVESQDHASHPVGTTVRITDFLSNHPVRKQVALKGAMKTIAKIKHLMQSYAFARPTTRLSFRILRAKTARDSWTYAPKPGAGAEEAALNVVGKPCASRCAWFETESGGFKICAYVPRIDADVSKSTGHGQYLSIDGRTMSSNRSACKRIVKAFKESMRGAGMHLEGTKEPFMFMSITCPEASYDPNVEPAKDDVLFADSDLIMAAVNDLLKEAYPPLPPPAPAHVPSCSEQYSDQIATMRTPAMGLEENASESLVSWGSAPKSNMYDMDEDDLELLARISAEPVSENAVDDADDQVDQNKTTLSSNPWVMAKINGRTGKTNLGSSGRMQLLTPAREPAVMATPSSSPTRSNGSYATVASLPTPRGSSPMAGPMLLPGLSQYASHSPTRTSHTPLQASYSGVSPSSMPRVRSRSPVQHEQGMSLDQIPEIVSSRKRGSPKKTQRGYVNKPFQPHVDPERDAWFEIPEVRAPQPRRSRRQTASGQQTVVPSGESLNHSQPATISRPRNNTDIRSFIGQKKAQPNTASQDESENVAQPAPFTPVDESTAPKLQYARASNCRLASGDFVPASELSMRSSQKHDQEDNEPPPRKSPSRRRKTSERALVQVSGNGNVQEEEKLSDPSYNPEQQTTTTTTTTSTRRRRTTDGGGGQRPGRLKSSLLPLERIRPDLQLQDVSIHSDMTSALIAASMMATSANETFLPWTQPAAGGDGALSLIGEEVIGVWTARVRALLRDRLSAESMVLDVVDMVRASLTKAVNVNANVEVLAHQGVEGS